MSAIPLTETELKVLRSCERWAAGDMDGRADELEGVDYRQVFISCAKLRDNGFIERAADPFAGTLTPIGQAALNS